MSGDAREKWVRALALELARRIGPLAEARLAAEWAEELARATDWEEDANPQWQAAREAMAAKERG